MGCYSETEDNFTAEVRRRYFILNISAPLHLCGYPCIELLHKKFFRQLAEYCQMLICVNVVQMCDARDDDSSNAADTPVIVF